MSRLYREISPATIAARCRDSGWRGRPPRPFDLKSISSPLGSTQCKCCDLTHTEVWALSALVSAFDCSLREFPFWILSQPAKRPLNLLCTATLALDKKGSV